MDLYIFIYPLQSDGGTRKGRNITLKDMKIFDNIKSTYLLLVILLSCSLNGISYASSPYQPEIVNPLTESWRWKHFPELDGKGIRFIMESSDQRVWVGSNEGVLEYDGYEWKTHNEENGLYGSPVEQILVANDGSIFATASNGIFKYDGEKWSEFFKVPENRSFIFHNIEQLKDNSLIACSDWGYVHFLNDGKRTFYTSPIKINQLKDDYENVTWIELPPSFLSELNDFVNASDVLETYDGDVWFAITTKIEIGKLLKFRWSDIEDGRFDNYEVIESREGFSLGEGQSLLQAKDERIWVINSSSNKGIHILDQNKWEKFSISQNFGGDEYLVNIVQSADGKIWISSTARIFAYENGVWEKYKAPLYPVPANQIMLQNSRNDKLWVAGYKSKVFQLDLSTDRWLTYQDLSFQCETSPDEQWYLEKDNRIIQRKGDIWTAYNEEDGLPDEPIKIIHTKQGQIWVAGSHQGKAATAVLKNGKWEKHLHPKLSWGIDYRSVFEAQDGSLWFGAAVDAEITNGFLSGILHLKNPTAEKLNWEHHASEKNGLNQRSFYGIGQSKDGRIWAGGKRLIYYNGNTWNEAPDERLQQYVNYVTSTDDLLLLGSRYYGLFIYDGEKWENYNTNSGLSSNTIISIDVLSDSTIIVATENGICKFDGKSWTKNIFPQKLNMDFEGGTIYHTNQFIWINRVSRSWKRKAYTNSTEGENGWVFSTSRYRPSFRPPETVANFFIESVSSDGNCIISWDGKDYFAQTSSDDLMYSYCLDDGAWSEFRPEKQHTFTSLPSGDHTLQVRARDLDFNIDKTPVKFHFEVLPPIWKQAWFIALILAFLTIYGIYEYRVIKKKRKLEILNTSLSEANRKLKERGGQIEVQNQEIFFQKEQILQQSKVLEANNIDLEIRNDLVRKQKDKLEEMVVQVENLSKAKLGFFTNISHELRTPLTLILGPIAQLKNKNKQLTSTQQNQFYHLIHKNASRLLKLINQLLEMRRIEQSALELNFSNIKLASYISDIVDLFKGLAIRRDIHLQFKNKTDNLLASLDSDKVEKIITNLLSNAFKYTPEGGSVLVEVNKVSAVKKGLDTFYTSYFEIIVEDSGAGISQEKIDFIFDKYTTSKSNIVDASHTGIGLSYTKDLVYLMQGKIEVESEVGKGSKFRIYLPFISEVEISDNNLTLEKPSFNRVKQEASLLLNTFIKEEALRDEIVSINQAYPHVLLVEDNKDMLQFVKSILIDKYRITTAENGVEGLKLASQQSFDLIISDVMMPEMNGFTLCEKIKNNLITSHLPVILLTAKSLEESKLSGYSKGADGYIVKPFNPEMLLVRIENILTHREKLREVFNKELMLTPMHENIESPDEIFLSQLITLINENLGESEFNVDSMCKSMFLSHMHFIRKVKKLTGKKPIHLLRSFRMKKAKDLLSQNKLTIAEVAYKVGFDLPNSFSRAFKKEYQQTPSEFVKSLGKFH